jgi:tetratricopeptide (TPR) repeat protein
MRSLSHTASVVLLANVIACGGAHRAREPTTSVLRDAAYELSDRDDLEWVRDRFDALPIGDGQRAAQRGQLLAEYRRRLEGSLARGEQRAAVSALEGLVTLWSARELADPRGHDDLLAQRELLEAARLRFARSGSDRDAALALTALRQADPKRAAAYDAELDAIFAFADDLAVAEFGEGAQRARPLEILESVLEVFPSPAMVDRLVALVIARQRDLSARFRRSGADYELVRAHGQGVLRTAWTVVRAYARGERLAEAPAAVAKVIGLGENLRLAKQLSAALDSAAEAEDWVMLASLFQAADPDAADLGAAFAICAEASRRFPRSEEGYRCAADYAYVLGASQVAIRYYELGLGLKDSVPAAQRLATLYLAEVTRLALSDRLREARSWLARMERFQQQRSERSDQAVVPDVADAHAAIGRGLLSRGELAAAREELESSLRARENAAAHELLGTIALKRDEFAAAAASLERALALAGNARKPSGDRNRLLRLFGEAELGRGRAAAARDRFREAMVGWTRLRVQSHLGRSELAEAEVERGKLYWHLGEKEKALTSIDRAVDLDPDGTGTHTEAVSFLLSRGEYNRALDAYHRALGSPEIRDYHKVYMSLWMLAEARRRDDQPDPLARDFLAARDGKFWYDDLARYASGRLELAPLEARADTRVRQAEFYYYSAVLGRATGQNAQVMRTKLERVLATDTVLFFEYDMAKLWLQASH